MQYIFKKSGSCSSIFCLRAYGRNDKRITELGVNVIDFAAIKYAWNLTFYALFYGNSRGQE